MPSVRRSRHRVRDWGRDSPRSIPAGCILGLQRPASASAHSRQTESTGIGHVDGVELARAKDLWLEAASPHIHIFGPAIVVHRPEVGQIRSVVAATLPDCLLDLLESGGLMILPFPEAHPTTEHLRAF